MQDLTIDLFGGPSPQLADVAVLKTTGLITTVATIGRENLAYLLTVSNAGPHIAEGAWLVDRLPPTGTAVFASSDQGAYDATTQRVKAQLGNMGVGESLDVHVAVTPIGGPMITNWAEVGSAVIDPLPANNTSHVVSVAIPALDTDRDGIPDWWTQDQFGRPTNALPNDDEDHDLITTLNEYRMLSSPHQANLPFRIEEIGCVHGGLVTFETKVGRTYEVQFKSNLQATAWWPLGVRGGTDARVSYYDPSEDPLRFYRVIIRVP